MELKSDVLGNADHYHLKYYIVELVDSDEENKSLLIIIICSSVAGTMVVVLLIVGLAFKCSTKPHQKSNTDKQADPQIEKTTGVYINTRIPRSNIGYVGPYPNSQ